jgi:predicted dehydrogenase
VLVRFASGAKGSATIGQVCAGHKNDLWLELNGAAASLRWRQEQQNELWIGHRDSGNVLLGKDPSLMSRTARTYAHLPAGHQEGWADAFGNVIRDIYTRIVEGPGAGAPRPAFATFEDGYRVALLVDAVLESHRQGGVWTTVHAVETAGGVR